MFVSVYKACSHSRLVEYYLFMDLNKELSNKKEFGRQWQQICQMFGITFKMKISNFFPSFF